MSWTDDPLHKLRAKIGDANGGAPELLECPRNGFCIHRGTQEIGGSCVELEAQSARILLDLGQPLDAVEATPDLLPDVSDWQSSGTIACSASSCRTRTGITGV